MAEESLIALWSAMTSWFTPTSLFLLLNLVIGTIALSSRFASQKNPNQQQPRDNPNHNFFRASSLLDRVKSVNFSIYRSESSELATLVQHSEAMEEEHEQTHQLPRVPSILERVKSFNFSFHKYHTSEPAQETQNPDLDGYDDMPATRAELEERRAHVPAKMKTSVSENLDTKLQSGEDPTKKMKKSASEKMKFWRSYEEDEEVVELRRPATVRETTAKKKTTSRGGEGSETTGSYGDDEGVDVKADDFINKFRQQLKLQRLDSLLRYSDMITRGASR